MAKIAIKPRNNSVTDELGDFVVRQSSIKSFRDCRRAYFYKQVERIEPKKPRKPLIRGTIIHAMIENFINGEDPWAAYRHYEKLHGKLFREERESYGTLLEDIQLLMDQYFKWFKSDPLTYLKHPQTGKRAEHKFRVQIAPGITQTGTIDSVAKSKDGRVWLVEHKSVSQLPTDLFRYSDIQSVTYTEVLEKLGFPKPDGVCWNYIRAKPPTVPELLKSGELSKRNIDTTWDVYAAAIKRHKLDPRDYEDMRKQLQGKEKDFFVRVYLPVKPVIVKNVMREVVATSKEMRRLHFHEEELVRNITRNCSWCQFFNLCQAELRELDASFIRKADFRPIKENEDEADKKANRVEE